MTATTVSYVFASALVFMVALMAYESESGTPRRIAALVALTAWAWPVWLLGRLVYMFIQLCLVAAGRRP